MRRDRGEGRKWTACMRSTYIVAKTKRRGREGGEGRGHAGGQNNTNTDMTPYTGGGSDVIMVS